MSDGDPAATTGDGAVDGEAMADGGEFKADTFMTSLRGGESGGNGGGAGGPNGSGGSGQSTSMIEVNGMTRVMELHGQLSGVVNSLSNKVADVLKKQESEFLAAYRAHMYNVQKELQELRAKVKNAELALQRDETIRQLTQERDWFRKEALRLDSYATAMKKEVKFMEEKLGSVEEDRSWLEKQLKTAKKQNKILRSELELHLEGKSGMEELLEGEEGEGSVSRALADRDSSNNSGKVKLAPIMKSSKSHHELGQLHTDPEHGEGRSKSSVGYYNAARPASREQQDEEKQSVFARTAGLGGELDKSQSKHQQDRHQIKLLREQLQRERECTRDLRALVVSEQHQKSEMEDFFLKCIEEAKKDFARRKNRAKLDGMKNNVRGVSDSPSARDISSVRLKDLSALDRRKILAKLNTFYDEIFAASKKSDEVDGSIVQQQSLLYSPPPADNRDTLDEARANMQDMNIANLLKAIP